jgi:hypothetical protein
MFKRKKHKHTFTKWAIVTVITYGRSGKGYEIDIQRRECSECGWVETANF